MLKKIIFLSTFMTVFYLSKAQSFVQNAEVGVFFGTSYYIGDLNEKHFNLTQPAIGLMYRWNLNRRFALKGSVWAGSIRGSDKTSNDSVRINRNLHFKSPLTELSGQIEFNFFEYETGMDTRIGFPNEHLAKGNRVELESPMYSTAVGLVMKGINSQIFIDQNQVLAADEDLIKEPQNSEQLSYFDKWVRSFMNFIANED